MNSNKASILLLIKNMPKSTLSIKPFTFSEDVLTTSLKFLKIFMNVRRTWHFFTQKIFPKESLMTTISVQYDHLCAQHVCRESFPSQIRSVKFV